MFHWLCWEILRQSSTLGLYRHQHVAAASHSINAKSPCNGLCRTDMNRPLGALVFPMSPGKEESPGVAGLVKLSFDMCTRWTQCEKEAQSILKYSAIKAPPSVKLSNSFLILHCVLHRLWLALWRTLKEMHCVGDNRKAISMFARWQHLWLPVRPLALAGEQLSCATKVINHWTKPLIDLISRNASPTCMAWRLAAVRAAWLSAH